MEDNIGHFETHPSSIRIAIKNQRPGLTLPLFPPMRSIKNARPFQMGNKCGLFDRGNHLCQFIPGFECVNVLILLLVDFLFLIALSF